MEHSPSTEARRGGRELHAWLHVSAVDQAVDNPSVDSFKLLPCAVWRPLLLLVCAERSIRKGAYRYAKRGARGCQRLCQSRLDAL